MRNRKLTGILAAATIMLVGGVVAPSKAQAMPYCYNWYAPTYDMQGVYFEPEIPSRITVNACGGIEIIWENTLGRHAAYYAAYDRIPGGGFLAQADLTVGDVLPNGSVRIAIKPAERGYIQMVTYNEFDQFQVFRLYKQ